MLIKIVNNTHSDLTISGDVSTTCAGNPEGFSTCMITVPEGSQFNVYGATISVPEGNGLLTKVSGSAKVWVCSSSLLGSDVFVGFDKVCCPGGSQECCPNGTFPPCS